MVSAAGTSDKPSMGPATQSELGAAKSGRAGLETGTSDAKPAGTERIQPELTALQAGLEAAPVSDPAARFAALEAQSEERLEATRRDAETALSTLATELESLAAARVDAAVREVRDESEADHAVELAEPDSNRI